MKKGLSEPSRNTEKAVRRNRKYDDDFKQQALAMMRNGQSLRSVAQALGISENLLYRWRRLAQGTPSSTELEVEQLRRQLKQVEMERDILKKALSIFSRQT